MGPARAIRFNFKAGLLYAVAKDWVKTFTLDEHGYPTGAATTTPLACGEIRDIVVDETTGKIYVACSQPPTEK